jgi:hypothetical protein
MGAVATTPAVGKSNALPAIFWGGLACGILDITQACIAWGVRGIPPVRILQSIASGVLGRQAFQGGAKTAILGGALHFLIAFTAAAVFYAASRKIKFLTQRPIVAGLLYGEVVYLVMNFVVVPLSAIHKFPTFTAPHIITGPIGHLFLVGLPISLAVRRYAGRLG